MLYSVLNYRSIPTRKVARLAPFTDGDTETPVAGTAGSRIEPRFPESSPPALSRHSTNTCQRILGQSLPSQHESSLTDGGGGCQRDMLPKANTVVAFPGPQPERHCARHCHLRASQGVCETQVGDGAALRRAGGLCTQVPTCPSPLRAGFVSAVGPSLRPPDAGRTVRGNGFPPGGRRARGPEP